MKRRTNNSLDMFIGLVTLESGRRNYYFIQKDCYACVFVDYYNTPVKNVVRGNSMFLIGSLKRKGLCLD